MQDSLDARSIAYYLYVDDKENELWLPVPGYVGFYEVSNLGRVASLARTTTRGGILNPQISSKGYRQVGLSKYGKVRTYRISELVLTAHVKPRPPGMLACHGVAGKQDDSVVNLYWGTPARNSADRFRDGTVVQGENCVRAKLTEVIVADCRRRYLAGETQTALCLEYGITTGAMSNAIHGRTWACVTDPAPVPADRDGRSYRSWTPEMRTRMSEAGRRGALSRWGSPPA